MLRPRRGKAYRKELLGGNESNITMRRVILIVILFFPSLCFAQAVWQPIQLTDLGMVGTVSNVVLILSGVTMNFCNHPASGAPCTNKATTYTDATATTQCNTSTQFMLNGLSGCVANLDTRNQSGVWVKPGEYTYTVTINGATQGPYYVAVGADPTAATTFTGSFSARRGAVQFIAPNACSEGGIAALISSVGSGGSAYAEGCTTPFSWSALLRIKSPVSLWLPCTTMIVTNRILGDFNAAMLVVESNDVHVHTCGNGSAGNALVNGAGRATQVIAGPRFPNNGNMIVAGQPLANRTSLEAARLSGFTLDPIFINMNGSGNRAIYTSSCWHCKLDHPTVANANCGSGPDGAITQEGALSGDTNGTESYFMDMEFPQALIVSGNTTCHPYFFDARNGEISQGFYDNLISAGQLNSTGSGSDSMLVQGGSAANDTFDKGIFFFPYFQNPVANAYGIRIEMPGNHVGATGGRFDQNFFIGPHLERIGQSASGTAIGCTQSGSANGTGCGGTILVIPQIGNWFTGIDYANMGVKFALVDELNNPSFQSVYRVAGTQVLPSNGDFYGFLSNPPKINGTGTNQNFHSFAANLRSTAFGGSTIPTTVSGFTALYNGATGNSSNAYGFWCPDGDPTFGSWTNRCFDAGSGTIAGGKIIAGGGAAMTSSGAGGTMASASGTLTSGNVPKWSGTAGALVDSGFAIPTAAGSATLEQIVASGSLSVTARNRVGCVDSTTAATGATTSMKVVVSPVSPQTNTQCSGYVSASNTADIHVCTIVALTGSAVTYNWSVIQ